MVTFLPNISLSFLSFSIFAPFSRFCHIVHHLKDFLLFPHFSLIWFFFHMEKGKSKNWERRFFVSFSSPPVKIFHQEEKEKKKDLKRRFIHLPTERDSWSPCHQHHQQTESTKKEANRIWHSVRWRIGDEENWMNERNGRGISFTDPWVTVVSNPLTLWRSSFYPQLFFHISF